MQPQKFEMYKLATMLLAEGTVTLTRKGGRVYFINTSEKLHELFKEVVNKLGYKVRVKDKKTLVVYSSDLARKLLSMCKSFRVKPIKSGNKIVYSNATFPLEVFEMPENKIRELLRIYFSCDGGPVMGEDKRNDEVIVRVCHPNLQKQLLKLLEKCGIKANVRGNGLIFIRKRSEMIKFYKKIGFIPGVKTVRGKHKGMEKNEVLKLILNRHSPVQTARQANRAELPRGFR
jgi:intein/homing endonuclease